MAKLNPDRSAFWDEYRESLLRNAILHRDRLTEYSLPVLTERLHELRECGKKSVLYSLSINEYQKKRFLSRQSCMKELAQLGPAAF